MDLVKLKVMNEGGTVLLTAPAAEQVSLVYRAAYKPGDRISLEIGTPGQYCIVQFEDTMPPVLLFVKEREINFHIPIGDRAAAYNPKSFVGNCHIIRARLAQLGEISARRNMALNPYDEDGDTGFYPHAATNVVAGWPAAFGARNAIDGVLENSAHGAWPYQSWGISRNPDAELTVDFGRPVAIDEIRLTLRADFPHDSWWTSATVRFSDSSSEVFTLSKTAAPQPYPISPRTVTSLVLCDLKKAEDGSPFPALTQIEAYGTEVN